MKQICDVKKCTGCGSCVNICPERCIEMQADAMGQIHPDIKEEKCIDCGLCSLVCQVNNPSKLEPIKKCFASWSSDELLRVSCTSGGLATVFARQIISQGGIVYGACMCKNINVKHIRVTALKDLEKIKGSKYVQSEIGNTYTETKNDLNNGLTVLFIGTPCQISGLKKFLMKEYLNLIAIDLICHGVPTGKLLKDDIYSAIGTLDVDNLSFRELGGYYIKVLKDDRIVYYASIFKDLYYIGFNKGLFFRESCYSCQYSQPNRVSDITIGDFWGIGKKIDFNHPTEKGISVLLPISDKGMKLINVIKDCVFIEERTIQEAIERNLHLNFPSKKHHNYEKFRKLYIDIGFVRAAKKCLRVNRFKYIILRMFIKIKKIKGVLA